jgi:acyl carrier protein
MDDMEARLAACFSAVLPELATQEISQARADSLVTWDSVTTITLITVVEEEFGINIEIDDPSQFDSFSGILNYLRKNNNQKKATL